MFLAIDRVSQPQAHQRHQLNNGREQQLARILLLAMGFEYLVHPARRQHVLQCHPRHHARRRRPLKPLQHRWPNQPIPIQR